MVESIPFNEVHIWTVWLNTDEFDLCENPTTFCAEEVGRADRFKSEQLRKRFLLGRSKLRCILSLYTGCSPDDLRFSCGSHGKSVLASCPTIKFNQAYSSNLLVVAVSHDREAGIDVEKNRNDDFGGVAGRVFSDRENSVLAKLRGRDRADAFFRIWTRKEAYVKALGVGFSYAMQGFSVSWLAGDTDVLLCDEASEAAATSWRVTEINAPAGYCAALAAAGRDWTCRYRQL